MLLERGSRDDETLHLGGALVYLGYSRVAVVALGRHLAHVAHAAEHLRSGRMGVGEGVGRMGGWHRLRVAGGGGGRRVEEVTTVTRTPAFVFRQLRGLRGVRVTVVNKTYTWLHGYTVTSTKETFSELSFMDVTV